MLRTKEQLSLSDKVVINALSKIYHVENHLMQSNVNHPAGDVTRVSVVPRKVTVKTWDVEK